MNTEKIKIGDKVIVPDNNHGLLYSSYRTKFKEHGIPFPESTVDTGCPDRDAKLTVVKFAKHYDGHSIVFVKDNKKRYFLYQDGALVLYKKTRVTKKIVTITIEVPMNVKQKKMWHKSTDYFNESVREAVEVIMKIGIMDVVSPSFSGNGEVETSSERAMYKVDVKAV